MKSLLIAAAGLIGISALNSASAITANSDLVAFEGGATTCYVNTTTNCPPTRPCHDIQCVGSEENPMNEVCPPGSKAKEQNQPSFDDVSIASGSGRTKDKKTGDVNCSKVRDCIETGCVRGPGGNMFCVDNTNASWSQTDNNDTRREDTGNDSKACPSY